MERFGVMRWRIYDDLVKYQRLDATETVAPNLWVRVAWVLRDTWILEYIAACGLLAIASKDNNALLSF